MLKQKKNDLLLNFLFIKNFFLSQFKQKYEAARLTLKTGVMAAENSALPSQQ